MKTLALEMQNAKLLKLVVCVAAVAGTLSYAFPDFHPRAFLFIFCLTLCTSLTVYGLTLAVVLQNHMRFLNCAEHRKSPYQS